MKRYILFLLLLFAVACRRHSSDTDLNLANQLEEIIVEELVSEGGVDEGLNIPDIYIEQGVEVWLAPADGKYEKKEAFVESYMMVKGYVDSGRYILKTPEEEGKYIVYLIDKRNKVFKKEKQVVIVDRRPIVKSLRREINGRMQGAKWSWVDNEEAGKANRYRYALIDNKGIYYKVIDKTLVEVESVNKWTEVDMNQLEILANFVDKSEYTLEVESYYNRFARREAFYRDNLGVDVNLAWSNKGDTEKSRVYIKGSLPTVAEPIEVEVVNEKPDLGSSGPNRSSGQVGEIDITNTDRKETDTVWLVPEGEEDIESFDDNRDDMVKAPGSADKIPLPRDKNGNVIDGKYKVYVVSDKGESSGPSEKTIVIDTTPPTLPLEHNFDLLKGIDGLYTFTFHSSNDYRVYEDSASEVMTNKEELVYDLYASTTNLTLESSNGEFLGRSLGDTAITFTNFKSEYNYLYLVVTDKKGNSSIYEVYEIPREKPKKPIINKPNTIGDINDISSGPFGPMDKKQITWASGSESYRYSFYSLIATKVLIEEGRGNSYIVPDFLRDGSYLLEVVAVDKIGNESDISSIEYLVESKPSANPQLTGESFVGSRIGVKVNFNDIGRDLEGTSLYQWYLVDESNLLTIDGAISSSLLIKDEYYGKKVKVEVIPVSQSGNPLVGDRVFSPESNLIREKQLNNPVLDGKIETNNKNLQWQIVDFNIKYRYAYRVEFEDKLVVEAELAEGNDVVAYEGGNSGRYTLYVKAINRTTSAESTWSHFDTVLDILPPEKPVLFLPHEPNKPGSGVLGPYNPNASVEVTWPKGDVSEEGLTYEYEFINITSGEVLISGNGTKLVIPKNLIDGEYEVVVRAIDTFGNKSEATKLIYIVESAPRVNPVVEGVVKVGELLSVSLNYNDEGGDLLDAINTKYKWYLVENGIEREILAQTEASLKILDKEWVGKGIKVEVIPHALTGYPKVGVTTESEVFGPITIDKEVMPNVSVDDENNIIDISLEGLNKNTLVYRVDGGVWVDYTESPQIPIFNGSKKVEVRRKATSITLASDIVELTFTPNSLVAPVVFGQEVTNNPLLSWTWAVLDTIDVKEYIYKFSINGEEHKTTIASFTSEVKSVDGNYEIYVKVVDTNAGESEFTKFTTRLDMSKPTKPVLFPPHEPNKPELGILGPYNPNASVEVTWPKGDVSEEGLEYEYTFVKKLDSSILVSGNGRKLTIPKNLKDGDYELSVVAIDNAGNKSEATKLRYIVESAPRVNPVVQGVAKVGELLTVSLNYSDEGGDLLDTINTKYKWYLVENGIETEILAHREASLNILDKEWVGKGIKVEVIPHALTGYPKVGVTAESEVFGPITIDKEVMPNVSADDTLNKIDVSLEQSRQGTLEYSIDNGNTWTAYNDLAVFDGNKNVLVRRKATTITLASDIISLAFTPNPIELIIEVQKDSVDDRTPTWSWDVKDVNRESEIDKYYYKYRLSNEWIVAEVNQKTFTPISAFAGGTYYLQVKAKDIYGRETNIVEKQVTTKPKAPELIIVDNKSSQVTTPINNSFVYEYTLDMVDVNNELIVNIESKTSQVNQVEYSFPSKLAMGRYKLTARVHRDGQVSNETIKYFEVEDIIYTPEELQNIVDNLLSGTGKLYRRSAGDIELNMSSTISQLPYELWIAQTTGEEYTGSKDVKASKFEFELRGGKYVIDAPISDDSYNLILVYKRKIYKNTKREIIVTNTLPSLDNELIPKVDNWDYDRVLATEADKEIYVKNIGSIGEAPLSEVWVAPISIETQRSSSIKKDYLGGNRDNQFEYEFIEGSRVTKGIVNGRDATIKMPAREGDYYIYLIDTAGNVSIHSNGIVKIREADEDDNEDDD